MYNYFKKNHDIEKILNSIKQQNYSDIIVLDIPYYLFNDLEIISKIYSFLKTNGMMDYLLEKINDPFKSTNISRFYLVRTGILDRNNIIPSLTNLFQKEEKRIKEKWRAQILLAIPSGYAGYSQIMELFKNTFDDLVGETHKTNSIRSIFRGNVCFLNIHYSLKTHETTYFIQDHLDSISFDPRQQKGRLAKVSAEYINMGIREREHFYSPTIAETKL